jgi:hypothetical protein
MFSRINIGTFVIDKPRIARRINTQTRDQRCSDDDMFTKYDDVRRNNQATIFLKCVEKKEEHIISL